MEPSPRKGPRRAGYSFDMSVGTNRGMGNGLKVLFERFVSSAILLLMFELCQCSISRKNWERGRTWWWRLHCPHSLANDWRLGISRRLQALLPEPDTLSSPLIDEPDFGSETLSPHDHHAEADASITLELQIPADRIGRWTGRFVSPVHHALEELW